MIPQTMQILKYFKLSIIAKLKEKNYPSSAAYLQDNNRRTQGVLENLGCELQENIFCLENITLFATGDANIAFGEVLSRNYLKMGINIGFSSHTA